jgi:hypothetical protein
MAGGVALFALLAGCSSASSTSSGAPPSASGASSAPGTASPAASGGATIGLGKASPGTDVGLTKTQIRVAIIADVNTPIEPGLFQKNEDVIKAWAAMVNAAGGLAGRKVVVDFCDSKLDPNATANCVIQACQNDFALVGTATTELNDVSDIDNCKNSAGQAIGIPNLAFVAFPPLACDKDTYLPQGYGPYCATAKDNPQSYSAQVGDFRYYASQNKDLHGIYVYDGDVQTAKFQEQPTIQGAVDFGMKKDGQGIYTPSALSPQSQLTPFVQVLKQNQSTFMWGGATPAQTILIRREAKLQGVNSVKLWACDTACYDSSFITEGGADADGEYVTTNYLPFYTDADANPQLKALISQMGGINKINGEAIESYVMALLFQDAVVKATANGGTLDRQTLFAALNSETDFDADGIVGPTNIAAHEPSPCDAISQVVNGQWKRVYPAAPGTFDCNPANIANLKLNVSS